MPDDIREPLPGLRLSEAIARLPLEAPERSAWPQLAERFDAVRTRPRGPRWPFALAAAAAAVLALALVLPMPRDRNPAPAQETPAVVAVPAEAGDLDELMAESAQLEALLATVSRHEVGSANTLLLGLELEDRIARLDDALASPELSESERTALWRERVTTLRDYASLQGTAQWVAVQGGQLDGPLVATF
ncbi:hypothetical protein [Arenimonas donghaensis]|uniref:Uncharacterized protein n=1 Tax=Arenimonas donghaensis DSM 18148 = HO3-R19 TaxID=1121014 RepID=A0A087MI54_9GAMM|nr:hypothetical protein [Arenimonas donghaensis]KFL36557.1 hypothetical protein N788_02825 [Arenimonas donghaensis DSM 18148 = HO3-R19]